MGKGYRAVGWRVQGKCRFGFVIVLAIFETARSIVSGLASVSRSVAELDFCNPNSQAFI